MRRYDSYKDSEVEWIGDIPSHWEMKKVKYLFEIRKRISGELGYDVLSVTQKGLKVKDIDSGKGQVSMDYTKYQIVNEDDFVMNHMDLLTGYVDVSKQLGVTSPDYRVFTLKDEKSEKGYYLSIFQFGYKNKIFYSSGQGSSMFGRWRLPSRQFNEFKFPYPSLSEQQQIVSFLDTKTSLIDSLIDKNQRKIELLKEKRQKLIEEVILNDEIERVRLEHVVDLIKRPINREDNETYNKIGMYNWGRGIFKYPTEKGSELGDSKFNFIKEGDLLLSGQFSWEGSVSIVGKDVHNCISSHRFHILMGRKDIVLNEYLWSYFTSQEGHFLLTENSFGSSGRNQPLNIGRLLKEKIPIPELSFQLKIKELVEYTRRFEKYSKSNFELLKEYRQSLISEVVTGKIKVV